MDVAGIPEPAVKGRDETAARELLELCLAQAAAPDDAELERALAAAERRLRKGPVLRAGEILDRRFRLLAPAVQGSLTATWRGFDLRARRPVAVEILHPQHIADPFLSDRFRAGLAAAAGHAGPDLARVVEADAEWEGFPYAVLEVPGQPLAARIGGLEPRDRRAIVLELCEAVARLHAAGVVHGALSPDTVRLDDHDRVVLSGVGLYGPGNRGTFAAPEEASPAYVATPAADVHLVALVALAVLRDAPVPYWVAREPERVLAEIPEAALVELLRGMLHWRAEERPALASVTDALRGDADHQLALARRAAERGRPELAVARFEAVQAARPTDRSIRRELALALSAAGRKAEAANALADALTDPALPQDAVESGLATLRELAAATGDADPLVRTLEVLSVEGRPGRDAALVELARFCDAERRPSGPAWEAVLAAHRTRDQAREALERLLALAREAADSRAIVRFGRELHPYLDDPAAAAALALTLGRTFLDALDDPDNGLLWLDRALEAGADDPALPSLLRTLRTTRGDWPQIVLLLEEEAGRSAGEAAAAHLRSAAATARWALADEDRAAALQARVLELDPTDADALRDVARRATVAGRHEDAAQALARLSAPRPADDCRRIDAWMAARRPDEALSAFTDAAVRSPDHVGLLQRGMVLALHAGDEERLGEIASSLADRLGPRDPGRRDALLTIADQARVAGRLAEAAGLARDLLDDDPQDGAATWVLVKVAWAAARTRAEPAWLRAAPRCLPAQEALARLIGGLLDPTAVLRWLAISQGLAPAAGASRVERAATVVDRLVRHGLVGPELFDRLAALAPEEAGWVEAVRQLWDGTGRSDVAFPVALAHAWCPIEGPDLFRRTHRAPIGPGSPGPTRPPGTLADVEAWATLLLRDEGTALSEEGELAPMGVDRQRRPAARIGDDDPVPIDRRLQITRGCSLEVRGSAVYLVSDAPLDVGGAQVTEARLADGAVVDVGGMRVEYLIDLPMLALPPEEEDQLGEVDEDEDVDEDDEATPRGFEYSVTDDRSAPEPDAIRAALFFREAGSERILPLVERELVIGPGPEAQVHLGAEGGGWLARIVHPDLGMYLLELRGEVGPGGPDSPRLLAAGDSFEVGGVRFEFQVVEARTPAPPPSRAPVADDLVPVLVVDDGLPSASVLPLRDGFTIGRGRRNDLQLAADGRLSRVHCTLLFAADRQVVVRDNNSSNGTLVNGELVAEHALVEGDQVSIGDTDLVFRWLPRRGIVAPLVDLELEAVDLVSDELELEVEVDDDDRVDDTGTLVPPGSLVLGLPTGRRTPTVSIEDGRAKLQAANAALAAVVESLDRAFGPGRGRAELQNLVDASPRRFTALFQGVDARATGLPEMVVLYNVAQRPEGAQRTLLNEALADLVDRLVAGAVEALPPAEVDPLLEALSSTRYREALRL